MLSVNCTTAISKEDKFSSFLEWLGYQVGATYILKTLISEVVSVVMLSSIISIIDCAIDFDKRSLSDIMTYQSILQDRMVSNQVCVGFRFANIYKLSIDRVTHN